MVFVHFIGAGEHPGHSLDPVLGDATSVQVAAAEQEGAARVELFGSFAKPAGSDRVLSQIGFLTVVLDADVALGFGHAMLRGKLGPFIGFFEVSGDAIASEIAYAQRVFCFDLTLQGCLAIPFEGLFHVRGDAVAAA